MFENLSEKMTGIFGRLRRKGRISESEVDDVMREVRIALLEADVNLAVAKQFIAAVKEKAIGEEVWESLSPDQMVIKFVRDELIALLGEEPPRFEWSPSPPTVILLCGLQGSGKTTTAAKLAVYLKKQGKKPLLAACDVRRPAAAEQLIVLGNEVGVPVFADIESKDAVSVAGRSIDEAKRIFCDTLVVDTGGRLQIDEEMMDEIRRIREVIRPSEVLLVADSTTGQEAVSVAKSFDETLGLTGLIFTKLDGDARGGAVLSVRAVTGRPVRFVGVGEGTDALEPFHGRRIADRILGYGDVLGLIERVEEAVEKDEIQDIQAQLKSGRMDFDSLLAQFRTIKRMGSLRSLLKLLPGGSQIPKEMLDQADGAGMARAEAIMLSMTPRERRNPDILSGSRKRRITAGSGASVEEVNRLIKGLNEMQRQMKRLTRSARIKGRDKGSAKRRRK